MPAFYVEASALVKHYLPEAGSEVLSELLTVPPAGDRFHTSLLSMVEVTSAIRRQVRAGRLTERTAGASLAAFRATVTGSFNTWRLGDGTVAAAVRMAEMHNLRSGDAIHLATALAIAPLVSPHRLVTVSSDGELIHAAGVAGLAVLDPAAPDALASLRGLRASAS